MTPFRAYLLYFRYFPGTAQSALIPMLEKADADIVARACLSHWLSEFITSCRSKTHALFIRLDCRDEMYD